MFHSVGLLSQAPLAHGSRAVPSALSLSYLDRPSTGTEVGRFERFVFLFLALVCEAFCFRFLGQ